MKKLIFKYIIIALVSLLPLFSGCNTSSSIDVSPTTPPQTNNDVSVSDNSQITNEQITIISPYFYTGSYETTLGDDATLYLEELFKENGFNVKFDRAYYNIDSTTCYEEYFSYLSQSMLNDNTIALVPGYKIDILSNYVSLLNLNKEIEVTAPNYYQYAVRNSIISNSNDKVIISAISQLDNVASVLISNSLISEYNKSIEKSEDYLSFINWAQNRNESLIPSVVLTFHDDITSRSNILYDMFLPLQGYIPLGSYFGKTYSLCVDAKKPDKVYDTTKLSFYDSMLENIEVTANYSKIVIKQENTANKNFNEYSSIIMPMGDMNYYSGIADYNFYPLNYTMKILNADMFLERKHENTYFAAAEGMNQDEALRLIDWIYDDIDNYISVKYGNEELNYSYDSNKHIVLSEAGTLYSANSPISNMINNIEFEFVLQSLPSNYLSEINTIEYVKGDTFSLQYENYQYLITTNNYIYDSVNRFTRRWESSVRALELTTERKVDYVPGSFKFDEIEDLIDEISKQ